MFFEISKPGLSLRPHLFVQGCKRFQQRSLVKWPPNQVKWCEMMSYVFYRLLQDFQIGDIPICRLCDVENDKTIKLCEFGKSKTLLLRTFKNDHKNWLIWRKNKNQGPRGPRACHPNIDGNQNPRFQSISVSSFSRPHKMIPELTRWTTHVLMVYTTRWW